MAEELMPVYEENVRSETIQGFRTRDDIELRVIFENTDLIETLGDTNDDLIDDIMIARIDAENRLQGDQVTLM